MNKVIDYSNLIRKHAAALSGIFTYADLAAITGTSEKTLLPRRIRQIEKAGILAKFIRGIYLYAPDFDPQVLSQRIFPLSYISLESVLAKNLVITTLPKYRVTAVKLGRKRVYQTKSLTIEHLSIKKNLFFGFTTKNDVNIADSEKAFLDCLYFYQKGRKPTFNIYEDINFERLDRKKIMSYLKKFKNPKFVKFVESVLNRG